MKIPYSYYNKNILSAGGRIGRMHFLRNKLIIYFVAWVSSFFYLKILYFVPLDYILVSIKAVNWFSMTIIIYLLRINDFKRLRDIYDKECPVFSAVGLFIFFTNPLGEFISLVLLPFVPKNFRALK